MKEESQPLLCPQSEAVSPDYSQLGSAHIQGLGLEHGQQACRMGSSGSSVQGGA